METKADPQPESHNPVRRWLLVPACLCWIAAGSLLAWVILLLLISILPHNSLDGAWFWQVVGAGLLIKMGCVFQTMSQSPRRKDLVSGPDARMAGERDGE
jgi:hypothetical protein